MSQAENRKGDSNTIVLLEVSRLKNRWGKYFVNFTPAVSDKAAREMRRTMRGWPVYVPNYGVATIEDVGAGIYGRDWIDLAYTDEEYKIRYGWTTLNIHTPVPPLDQIPWILP